MVKREVKRKVRNTLFLTFAGISIVISLIFISVAVINFMPLFSMQPSSNDEVIAPVVKQAELSDLKKMLDDKNLIFDEINISSSSGDIVGKIREGPTVYFGINQEINWQVESLILILSKTRSDNKKPLFIDLRSTRPIVKF